MTGILGCQSQVIFNCLRRKSERRGAASKETYGPWHIEDGQGIKGHCKSRRFRDQPSEEKFRYFISLEYTWEPFIAGDQARRAEWQVVGAAPWSLHRKRIQREPEFRANYDSKSLVSLTL